MIAPCQSANEEQRLEALHQYKLLDTLPEEGLDCLTELAAHICDAPISLISLVDEDRQWFKSKFGLSASETARNISFCGHAILQPELFIVPDAAKDRRFADNPLVTREPNIRFYAGAPLITAEGHALGVLCVIDHEPRQLNASQEEALRALSRHVMTQLELRRRTRELIESDERLQMTLDAARMGTFDCDVSKNRITWSRGHEALWGFKLGEFDGTYETLGRRIHPDDLPGVSAEMIRCMAAGQEFAHEFRIVRPDGSIRWLQGLGEFDFGASGQPVRMRGVVLEITERKRAQERIQNVNRMYALVSDLNHAIAREKNPQALLESACRIAVEKGLFRMAWIGLLDSNINQINVATEAGEIGDYLEKMNIILGDEARGRGPVAEALRTGSAVVCNDIEHDSRMAPWREDASRMGFRACASFPLKVEDKTIGTFTLYAGTSGDFETEELRALSQLALDISFALANLQRETEHRKAEEKLRLRASVFEAQADRSADGILVVDSQENTIFQNRRLRELFKIPAHLDENEDHAGQLRFIAGRTKNPQKFMDRVLDIYAHADKVSWDIIELADGTVLDRCSSPVLDKTGSYYGRLWAFRDMTPILCKGGSF